MIKFIGTAQDKKQSLLYYAQTEEGNNFNVVTSNDGFEFEDTGRKVAVVDNKQKEEKDFDWKSFRIAKQDYQYFLTYKTNSKNDPNLYAALSTDLIHWQKTGKIDIKETGALIPDYKFKDRYVMYFGEENIKVAYSSDLRHWETDGKTVIGGRKDEFDNGNIEVANAYEIDGQILLIYYIKKKADKKEDDKKTKNTSGSTWFNKLFHNANISTDENNDVRYSVGAALFDKENPENPVWRSGEPIWEHPSEFFDKKMQPLGSAIVHDELVLYWLVDKTHIFVVSCEIPNKQTEQKIKDFSTLFKKSKNNPIISPRPDFPWESRATFNSAAVYEDGKVHFVYRALGDKDLSVLGYATSVDGLNIDWRSDEPIYIPREAFETPGQQVFATFADHFASGGGYGGVEDPRITKVEDKFFMTYVAFDGANPPRVALTSIPVEDFLKKNWDKWEKPKLISAPGMVNKNAVIFPEKVNGKYVVFHRIYPNILVDYVDDLSFDNSYLQGHHFIPPRIKHWDSKKIGAGAPPIKTDDGWLFVYQSVGHQDPHKYKIGAMLLDINNPSKVLSRTTSPIIEPVENYENEGFKAGVAYPCGAVAFNNKLHVYYGGADTVVCAATADLDKFLHEMKHDKQPELRKAKSALFN